MRAAAIVLALFAWLASPTASFAHAVLVSSDPGNGAVLRTAPKEFTLTFNNAVVPVALQLADPYGDTIRLTNFSVRDHSLVIEAPSAFGQGTHTLSWRVIAADGHPSGGSLSFSIDKPSIYRGPSVEIQGDPAVHVSIWIARLLIFAGLFLGVGGAFAGAWIRTRRSSSSTVDRVVIALIAAGALATLLSVVLQGLDALAAPLKDLWWWTAWRIGGIGGYGMSAAITAAALILGALSLHIRNGTAAKILSATALIAVGLGVAAAGHANTVEPRMLAVSTVFVHAGAITFWIGSLLPLRAFVLAGKHDTKAALSWFSKRAPFALVLIIASGVLLVVLQFDGQVSAPWRTNYGRVFALKCLVLIVLFALAGLNRFWLVPRLIRGEKSSARWLSGSIAGEVTAAVVIFAVVGLWRFTPPPRALAAQERTTFFTHVHGRNAMANVTIDPGRVGRVHTAIVLQNPRDEKPLAVEAVTIVLARTEGAREVITRHATKSDDGSWQVDNLPIPAPGIWQMSLQISINDFQQDVLNASIDIKP